MKNLLRREPAVRHGEDLPVRLPQHLQQLLQRSAALHEDPGAGHCESLLHPGGAGEDMNFLLRLGQRHGEAAGTGGEGGNAVHHGNREALRLSSVLHVAIGGVHQGIPDGEKCQLLPRLQHFPQFFINAVQLPVHLFPVLGHREMKARPGLLLQCRYRLHRDLVGPALLPGLCREDQPVTCLQRAHSLQGQQLRISRAHPHTIEDASIFFHSAAPSFAAALFRQRRPKTLPRTAISTRQKDRACDTAMLVPQSSRESVRSPSIKKRPRP